MKRLIGLAVLLCIASLAYVPAAKASTVALTWTLSTADTTVGGGATAADIGKAIDITNGCCSNTLFGGVPLIPRSPTTITNVVGTTTTISQNATGNLWE